MKNYVKEYNRHKVPKGATHWLVNGFAKWDDNKSISVIGCFQGATWKKCSYGMLPNAIELPEAEQEWNGEGLPPVGAECVMSYDGNNWVECVINYSSEHTVVCTNESGIELVYSTKDIVMFRPKRTQKEKDREAFIDKALEEIETKAGLVAPDKAIFEIMHEAGFTAPKAGDDV